MTSSLLRAAACLLLLLPSLALAAEGAGKDTVAGVPPAVGEVPPDILGNDRNGNPVTISQHRGKVVIVTFWASWCGPCRRELPMLGHVQQTVGREHLEVIAVNFKEHRQDFLSVIRANKGIDLTYVHDKGTVSDLYGANSLPNMFIIGQDGLIAHTHIGYSEKVFQQLIEEILALLPAEALNRPAKAG